jgi:hypothetical protein
MKDRIPKRPYTFNITVNLDNGPIIQFIIVAKYREQAREFAMEYFGAMQSDPREYKIECKEW